MGLTSSGFSIRPATFLDGPVLAVLHQAAFQPRGERAWSDGEIRSLLTLPGVVALLALDDQAPPDPLGLILIQIAGDEAELLTLGVRPDRTRRGVGSRLLDAALHHLDTHKVGRFYLEVAQDNTAAQTLYVKKGFHKTGTRPGYYTRDDGTQVDALVYCLSFPSGI